MLDVRHASELGIRRRLDPYRVRAQRALDPPRDDLVLMALLGAAPQLLAEVVVHGGIGTPPGAAVAATAPLRRPSNSGLAPRRAPSGVPQQKQKQDGNSSLSAP